MSTKSVKVEDVVTVFDDERIQDLAAVLPPNANIKAFADAVREGALIFARDVRAPTANQLHKEIANLHEAADRQQYDRVADALDSLSPQARQLFCDRETRPYYECELPPPAALRDISSREAACAAIVTLSQFGGGFVPGRIRPSGKRSRPSWRPLVYAPSPRRNFQRRNAERDFVIWLSIAWLEATGRPPSRTARHPDASRRLGPFATLVHKCLRLVGAPDADVVELINELQRRRREGQKSSGE
jgi:hypothetical protein